MLILSLQNALCSHSFLMTLLQLSQPWPKYLGMHFFIFNTCCLCVYVHMATCHVCEWKPKVKPWKLALSIYHVCFKAQTHVTGFSSNLSYLVSPQMKFLCCLQMKMKYFKYLCGCTWTSLLSTSKELLLLASFWCGKAMDYKLWCLDRESDLCYFKVLILRLVFI